MSMRIWLLDPANIVHFYSVCLADALVQAGADLRFITSPYIYDLTAPTAEQEITEYHFFRFLGKANLEQIASRPRLRRLLRGLSYPIDWVRLLWRVYHERPDIIHLQWPPMPALDRLALQMAKRLGVQIVYTVHNILPHDTSNPTRDRAMFGPLYVTADALIVHAHQNREELLATFPDLSPEKVHVIPLGPLFSDHAHVEREAAKAKLGVTGPTVLFFGALRPYKGLDDLIEAFSLVRKTLPEAQLLIVGKATPQLPAHIAQIEQLGLSANVHIQASFIPSVEIGRYYGAADVVALPYRKVYQSANLMTALAFSRPVVVSDVGGLPEVVEAADCGLIVPAQNPIALAEALIQLLENQNRAERLGQNARQFIETEMSWRKITEMTIALYANLLTENAKK